MEIPTKYEHFCLCLIVNSRLQQLCTTAPCGPPIKQWLDKSRDASHIRNVLALERSSGVFPKLCCRMVFRTKRLMNTQKFSPIADAGLLQARTGRNKEVQRALPVGQLQRSQPVSFTMYCVFDIAYLTTNLFVGKTHHLGCLDPLGVPVWDLTTIFEQALI